MSAQHTPGPWRYDYEPGYCGEIIASNGKTICTFGDEPLPSNAQLLASVPDLLEALKLADRLLSGANMNRTVVERKVRSAISKATGATP